MLADSTSVSLHGLHEEIIRFLSLPVMSVWYWPDVGMYTCPSCSHFCLQVMSAPGWPTCVVYYLETSYAYFEFIPRVWPVLYQYFAFHLI